MLDAVVEVVVVLDDIVEGRVLVVDDVGTINSLINKY